MRSCYILDFVHYIVSEASDCVKGVIGWWLLSFLWNIWQEKSTKKNHVSELCLHALSMRRASAHLVVKTHIEEIPRCNEKSTRPCHVGRIVCGWASALSVQAEVRHSLYRSAEADTSPRVLNVWRGGNAGCPRERNFMVWLSESMWDYVQVSMFPQGWHDVSCEMA